MADIKEKSTGWDSFEMRQQKAANDRLRQQLAAKRGIIQQKPEIKKKITKIKPSDSVVEVDSIDSIIEDLRNRFVNQGKEMSGDESVRAMQQFMRYTDMELSKKNIAGGSIFTEANRIKYADTLGEVYKAVSSLREPVRDISFILRTNRNFDNQHLENISYKLHELVSNIPKAVDIILHHPAVIASLQEHVPFWVGGGTNGGGHNIGFKKVLKQFEKDIKHNTYQNIIDRIEDYIKKGKDPLSYVVEGKKLTIKESVLRKLIRESIQMHLNEGTMDNDAIEKWYQVEEQIGPKQMLDCIFQWTDADTIDQWLHWFEQEEWVDFGDSSYIDDEEEDDENNFGV